MVYLPSSIVQEIGGSGWETNPPRLATRPATGVEDQEAHRGLTTPICKDNREKMDSQVGKILNQIFLNEWRHVDEIRCEHEKSYDHDDHAYHA